MYLAKGISWTRFHKVLKISLCYEFAWFSVRQTLKPILLYGCEIWGYFNPFTSRFKNGNIPIDQFFSKLHCEKLHLKFCKFLLGVHKKSTNLAVQSELCRFPLHFDILKQILRFWHRLENLDSSFPLLKAAYTCTKNVYEGKQPSWYGSVLLYCNIL